MDYTVRTTTEDDWAAYRATRLEMLADSPSAFGTTLAEALVQDEAFWRRRASGATSFTVVAIAEDGRWLGSMSGVVDLERATPVPLLVAVYVTPDVRGSGVADDLLEAVEAWAAERGEALFLDVHDANARAMRFYARHGYERTGHAYPHPRDPGLEVEMRRMLV
ncbi:GNAT family N-acetyltransferase [Glaciibacter flavus]|uniref:GNAT family N-acetyltransferase n=1 Tax=Orlajensenia flava TaxID=2565934 RepID=A0A4S4FX21_9MICO|nr:GNAT family N-acetyltransferase [Glaciibacter flavus]THG34196.1 GNAT family N-acetyltransferase [Glaciibacter flavus]